MTSVDLSDSELVLLDGKVSPKVQIEIERAQRRIHMASRYPDLAPHLAGFVSSVVDEALEAKMLLYRYLSISYCPCCKKFGGYHIKKSGRYKGQQDHSKPRYLAGVEFAWRFVTIQHSVTVGACRECVDAALTVLKDELRSVQAQIPEPVRHPDAPELKRWHLLTCLHCGWQGHEGEAGDVRTLFGDGTYKGACPSCKRRSEPLGKSIFEQREGYAVVPVGSEVAISLLSSSDNYKPKE